MLPYSKWLDLPINTRHEIARIFNITKHGSTHVQDNIIVSDGYNIREIEKALTVQNIQDYLHDYIFSDLDTLFSTMVYRLENPDVQPTKHEEIPTVPTLEIKTAKKTNATKKTTTKK